MLSNPSGTVPISRRQQSNRRLSSCSRRSFVRVACTVLCAALATLVSSVAPAQTIDVSLNVHYSDPGDLGSGGTWEVVAKTDDSQGVHGLSLRLADIDPLVQFDAPIGRVNASIFDNAGFWVLSNSSQTGHRNVALTQAAVPVLGPGEEQSLFYGVGTITNGMPGDVGPAFTSLSNLQNAPWAPVPPGDAFGDAAWDTAAQFASGTFAAGFMPEFFEGTSGQVFTSLGTSTTSGAIELATITTIVRTNAAALPGDYNMDGKVDAADYVLWRSDPASYGGDPQGYIDWVNNFGAMAGSGAGMSPVGFAVPEPGTGLLLALGVSALVVRRRLGTGSFLRSLRSNNVPVPLSPPDTRHPTPVPGNRAILFCAKTMKFRPPRGAERGRFLPAFSAFFSAYEFCKKNQTEDLETA